ncbi:stage II sporulation protein E [Bacillus mesophilus]|uniref:Stage II sporulation protein E n=1 Tax=Bacillus mesophilus TaxID=1808955 RepID=A0A6M0QCW6_9BACI|nr:stage II sporulation protein E [Bacillus mesophilus]MBM7663435.1 stage II sporulation protein E [Bacillus mesophilus]NEY74115.1 stage II sporulation protein E [Bacillus mesophilus]
MHETGRNVTEAVAQVTIVDRVQNSLSHELTKLQAKVESILFQKGLLLMFIGFLLGRALILEQIMPFALPYFAAVFTMKRDKSILAMISLVAGAATVGFEKSGLVLATILLFLAIRLIITRFNASLVKALPYIVFSSVLAGNLIFTAVTSGGFSLYHLSMVAVEAGLSFILTMIFLQSVPLISMKRRKQALKTEEMISLIILLASILTGTMGWTLYDLSIEHIFSRYLVLIFAFCAGATVGSTVGVVTGLILSLANVASLYQMSLLAFSGLLGGLLKEGKKFGVGIGLLIGTLLIGLYGTDQSTLLNTVFESLLAIALFLVTPQSLISKVARFIPGTAEHSAEQQQYLRKIRDVTANRVEQFSSVFQALSSSFSQYGINQEDKDDEKEIDYFLSNVTEKTCQACFKKEFCWSKNFTTTYEHMHKIMKESEEFTINRNVNFQREWDKYCVKSTKVIDAIQHELTFYQANKKLKRQVKDSRRLVADQLLGVSQVMGDFAKEIQRERENHTIQEEQILDALREFGIEIGHADIYSLEQGNVDIEMSIPYCNGRGECEKIIAPILSDIMQETIVVKREECSAYPNGNCHVSFGSAKTYVIETGVANAAMGGGFVSGDSYSTIELGAGKYAIAISDGMGNGERAHLESNETLLLLQKILKSGIEEKVAIKSVNSVLALRTTDEIFTTLDLAMIDLQDGNSKFLKIGSTPSFVKRGEKVIKIEASNLPMGIIQEFDVDVVSEQLKAGDLLIMMSDGIFEGPKHVENYDMWMKRKINELETDDPQEVADIIMEEVIRSRGGQIEDDMTIVVAKVKRNLPRWAAISLQRKKGNASA